MDVVAIRYCSDQHPAGPRSWVVTSPCCPGGQACDSSSPMEKTPHYGHRLRGDYVKRRGVRPSCARIVLIVFIALHTDGCALWAHLASKPKISLTHPGNQTKRIIGYYLQQLILSRTLFPNRHGHIILNFPTGEGALLRATPALHTVVLRAGEHSAYVLQHFGLLARMQTRSYLLSIAVQAKIREARRRHGAKPITLSRCLEL